MIYSSRHSRTALVKHKNFYVSQSKTTEVRSERRKKFFAIKCSKMHRFAHKVPKFSAG